MNQRKLKKVINMLRHLHNQRHRNVLMILEDKGPLNVTEIRVEYFREFGKDLTQPIYSVILSDFRRYGIVKFEKVEKFHYYSVNFEKLERIRGLVAKLNNYVK